MPFTMTASTQVQAPQQRVFEVFTDFANAATNLSGVKSLEVLTQGPIGKGTRFRETRIMMGKDVTETMEITSFQPPDRYSVGCESCGARYQTDFRLEPSADGTRVEISFTGTPLTFFAKVMGFLMRPMVSRMMRKCLEQDLADLKRAAETTA